MEFGRKTMNIPWSLARWPISNWKASQICVNLNSDAKKKGAKMKIFKKMPFLRPKRWNLAKNDEHPMESCPLTHFQSKSCTNFCEYEFRLKLKQGLKQKFLNKCHFGGRRWTYRVLLVDTFPIEKLHKFVWI